MRENKTNLRPGAIEESSEIKHQGMQNNRKKVDYMHKLRVYFPCKYSLVFASDVMQKYLNEQIVKEKRCPCITDAECAGDEQGSEGTIYMSISGELRMIPRQTGFSWPAVRYFGSLNAFSPLGLRAPRSRRSVPGPGCPRFPSPGAHRGTKPRRDRGTRGRSGQLRSLCSAKIR